MQKIGKVVFILLIVAVAIVILLFLFIRAWWGGTFNFMLANEIASYDSPEGTYTLVFEQMGDPAWPFGPTEIRLTLKSNGGKIIERVSTQVMNDGGNASEYNMKSIAWRETEVVIVIRGSEMEDKEIMIKYN